ncbi:MAG: hypothetical protein WC453_02135 [Patescibacteria group bacterium]
MKILKKYAAKVAFSLGLFGLGFAILGQKALAAADADYIAALATGTLAINDNTPATMSFLATTWGKALLIGLTIAALTWAYIKIRGAITGGRRRR